MSTDRQAQTTTSKRRHNLSLIIGLAIVTGITITGCGTHHTQPPVANNQPGQVAGTSPGQSGQQSNTSTGPSPSTQSTKPGLSSKSSSKSPSANGTSGATTGKSGSTGGNSDSANGKSGSTGAKSKTTRSTSGSSGSGSGKQSEATGKKSGSAGRSAASGSGKQTTAHHVTVAEVAAPYVAQLHQLEGQYLGKLGSLVDQAKQEYATGKYTKTQLYNKYLSSALALENQAQAQVNVVLMNLLGSLQAHHLPIDEIQVLKAQYQNAVHSEIASMYSKVKQ